MNEAAEPTTDDPARRLAEEVIAQLADGEAVDLPAAASRLPTEEERRRCLQILEEALRVQGLLPTVLHPGQRLGGHYRLIREIGAGGMGRVFEAEDEKLHRRVAVKVLTMLGGRAFDPARQFLQEAWLHGGLQHPNIVAVHELGSFGGQPFLAMELVDGTPLSDVIEAAHAALAKKGDARPRDGALLAQSIGRPVPAGRRPPAAGDDWFHAIARVVLELARTLEAAHAQGIVHRDLKPQNVMLRGDGTPVVLDFGLAGTLDHAGEGVTRGLFGTVAYLAPEQATSGRVGTDPRSDVYQLGVLLYELLVLQRAFPGNELSTLLVRVGKGEFLRPRAIDRGVPAELEAVCLRAMELAPGLRYQSVTELREDLQRWVEDGVAPLAARGGSMASGVRITRYALRRHRLGFAVAGTLAAALLAWVALKPPAPPWSGDVIAFRLESGALVAQMAPEFTSVKPGDKLGIVLRSEEPAWIYALSVFGSAAPKQYVAPMVVKLADTPDAEREEGFGRFLKAGEMAACTQIAFDAPQGQREGLLVFASATEQPAIEAWMTRLHLSGKASGLQYVPYAEARDAFAAATTRGELAQLDPATRNALAALSAEKLLGEEKWSLSDPRRWEFSFPVER